VSLETLRPGSGHPDRRGILEALGAATLFGLSMPAIKPLAETSSPLLMTGLLYSGAAFGLFGLLVARHLGGRRGARPSGAGLRFPDLPWLAGSILFGGILAPVLLVSGLAVLPASEVSLLLNLEIVFTVAIAAGIVREEVDRRAGFGIALTLAGALALSWTGSAGFAHRPAALLVAGACLSWALDNNLMRRIAASDPITVATVKSAVAGLVNIGVALARGAALPSAGGMGWILLVGFLGYGLSLTLFIGALRRIGTAKTGGVFATAPFVGALASVVWRRDPIGVPLVAAAVLMAGGLSLLMSERRTPPRLSARR